MNIKSILKLSVLSLFLLFPSLAISGPPMIPAVTFSIGETDAIDGLDALAAVLFYAFDLRDRETYIQFTFPFTDSGAITHVQIFDVSNNCNENDFFDRYTPNDTHIYNMRDIQTNDGNPSGVSLPEGAYGIIAITSVRQQNTGLFFQAGIGNFRILDQSGYEYRTNAVQYGNTVATDIGNQNTFSSFNFNTQGGISLSDIMGISVLRIESDGEVPFEWQALPVQDVFFPFDVDIYDLNETPFSCRDVVFSCVNESNPLLEELLEISGSNVASFEYGINDAIPHSKGGELLCPGNNISNGIVVLTPEQRLFDDSFFGANFFTAFIGLNNGNGRGSMDSLWTFNFIQQNFPPIAD